MDLYTVKKIIEKILEVPIEKRDCLWLERYKQLVKIETNLLKEKQNENIKIR